MWGLRSKKSDCLRARTGLYIFLGLFILELSYANSILFKQLQLDGIPENVGPHFSGKNNVNFLNSSCSNSLAKNTNWFLKFSSAPHVKTVNEFTSLFKVTSNGRCSHQFLKILVYSELYSPRQSQLVVKVLLDQKDFAKVESKINISTRFCLRILKFFLVNRNFFVFE